MCANDHHAATGEIWRSSAFLLSLLCEGNVLDNGEPVGETWSWELRRPVLFDNITYKGIVLWLERSLRKTLQGFHRD